MIRLTFLLLFLHTLASSTINIDKKAITISLSSTLSQSKNVAKELSKYDIYIYRTTKTKEKYYVIYAVNIEKENQNKALKFIKKRYKNAYITSDTRLKKLHSTNVQKNIFIKSKKKPFYNPNNLFIETTINLNKQSLFITHIKNKKELFPFLKKYRKYDLFIERIKKSELDNYDSCCSVYIVNIHKDDFHDTLKIQKSFYPSTHEVQSTQLKYKNERDKLNKFIKKY